MIRMGFGETAKSYKGLVLIRFEVAEGNSQSEETTWAKPLGNDLYEIQNPLDLITGFNVQDVVRAVAPSRDKIPSVIELVRRGGHRTLHVLFLESVAVSDQLSTLNRLEYWGATYKPSFDRFYTVTVPPEGNYQEIREHLASLMSAKLLMYEPGVDINTLHRVRVLGSGIV